MKPFYTAILCLSLASLMAGTSCRNDEVGNAPLTESRSSLLRASSTPADDERYKGLFDASEDHKLTPGFVGGHYNQDGTAGLVVLNDTITYATSGPWMAAGLLRNETGKSGAYPSITAILLDKAQRELGRVTYRSPLPLVFQGEPVPFLLHAEILASRVHRVRWGLTMEEATSPSETRNVALRTFWNVPYGGRNASVEADAYGNPLYFTRAYLAVGDMTNTNRQRPLQNPFVLAAWMDANNEHVLWVAEVEPEQKNGMVQDKFIEPSTSRNFVLTVDNPAIGPKLLDDASIMLWGASH